MKKNIKPILLITLLVVLAVLIIIPAKSFAKVQHLPGRWGSGPFGQTCWCPILDFYECGCAIIVPEQ